MGLQQSVHTVRSSAWQPKTLSAPAKQHKAL